jgi:ketosteroid isomerase-like protein
MSYHDVVRAIYDGLAVGNDAPMFEALSPTVEWIEAENIPFDPGSTIIGPEGVSAAVFEQLAVLFAKFSLDPIRIVASDTTVLVEGRYVGTTVTGKDLDAIYAHVWDFEGDKVVRFQQYSDTWQWRRVLDVEG